MTRLRTMAIVALTLSLGACGAHFDEADVADERALPPDLRTLRVRVPLGSVTVHAGPPGALRLDGRRRKTAATAEDLQRLLEVEFEPRFEPAGEPGVYRYWMPELPDGVDPRESAMILRAELYLPREIAVDLETGRGFLSVVGRDADVRLHTGSGDVHLEDVEGEIDVFSGLGGGILHRIRGSVTMETGGGAVLAFIERIGERGIRIKTREPSITVHLPVDAGFELDARVIRSTVGKIGVRDSFGVPVVEDGSGHVARGRVGAGGPPVVLETGAGWLSVPLLAEDGVR